MSLPLRNNSQRLVERAARSARAIARGTSARERIEALEKRAARGTLPLNYPPREEGKPKQWWRGVGSLLGLRPRDVRGAESGPIEADHGSGSAGGAHGKSPDKMDVSLGGDVGVSPDLSDRGGGHGGPGASLGLGGREREHDDVDLSLGLAGEGDKHGGAEISLTIVEASDLIGKDGRLFRKATSDPFVKVLIAGEEIAQTEYVSNNLSPTWNAKVLTDHKIGPTFDANPEVRLCIFDYDLVTAGDPMGEVYCGCAATRLRPVRSNDKDCVSKRQLN